MKVTETRYKSTVVKARKLLKMRHELKYDIAKLSFEVCKSTRGGRAIESHYTVTQFATDIGIGYKALQRWRREYDLVISKLGAKQAKEMKRKTLENVLLKVNKSTPKTEVKKLVREVSKEHKDVSYYHLLELVKRARQIEFNICHNLVLNKQDKKCLEAIHKYAKNIDKALTDHFKGKKRPKKKVLKKVAQIKQIIDS